MLPFDRTRTMGRESGMAIIHPSREHIQLVDVLAALGHPMRLQVLKVLASGGEHPCGSILSGVSKSTLTHHWRVLREGGVIWQKPVGRELLISLRREDLDARFPGLIDVTLAALSTSDTRRSPARRR
jgi:DNA-binding transcriptional ArsR family regulator